MTSSSLRLHVPSVVRVAAALGAAALAIAGGCYTNNQGTDPRLDTFYFPTGIAVSAGQTTMYVANSDFDLQFNGGTVFSIDLAGFPVGAPAGSTKQVYGIRDELQSLLTALLARDPTTFGDTTGAGAGGAGGGAGVGGGGGAVASGTGGEGGSGAAIRAACASVSPQSLQENAQPLLHPGPCSPIDITPFLGAKAIIGAFASGVALAYPPEPTEKEGARLLVPVRGDPSVTTFGIADDRDGGTTLAPGCVDSKVAATCLACGQQSDLRCAVETRIGTVADNQRQLLLPEEPVGIAVSAPVQVSSAQPSGTGGGGGAGGADAGPMDAAGGGPMDAAGGGPSDAAGGADGSGESVGASTGSAMEVPNGTAFKSAVVVAHQTRNAASLLEAPWDPEGSSGAPQDPSLQFILPSLENGPTELAAIPIPKAVAVTPGLEYSPGFVLTYRTSAQVDVLRAKFDAQASSPRPYLIRASQTPVHTSASGADQRGVAIDATERDACEAACGDTNASCLQGCLDVPLHLYIASRAPAALITGLIHTKLEITDGAPTGMTDTIELTGQVPLTQGPSRVAVGHIIGTDGQLHTRVFAVAFDTRAVFGYDPELDRVDITVRTGRGPQAVAFDVDTSAGDQHAYMYVAHFTDSYVGVVDLDARHYPTFGTMFATLGTPVAPRETQ